MTHRDRAGEPSAGESVGASESLDDAPHRPRLPSYPPVGPTDRLRDLYGSLSALLGIRFAEFGQPVPDIQQTDSRAARRSGALPSCGR